MWTCFCFFALNHHFNFYLIKFYIKVFIHFFNNLTCYVFPKILMFLLVFQMYWCIVYNFYNHYYISSWLSFLTLNLVYLYLLSIIFVISYQRFVYFMCFFPKNQIYFFMSYLLCFTLVVLLYFIDFCCCLYIYLLPSYFACLLLFLASFSIFLTFW